MIRSRNQSAGDDLVPTNDAGDRHIAPPRGTVELAERHRLLDGADGRLDPSPATFAMLAARDAAQLPGEPGGAPVVSSADFAIAYLPDPVTRDAVLLGLPGAPAGARADATDGGLDYRSDPGGFGRPASVTRVPFRGTWPELAPFRLVVVEGSNAPQWHAGRRELQVALPKATVATVSLAGGFAAADLGLLGIWSWTEQAAAAQRQDLLARTPGPDLGLQLNDLAAALGAATQAAVDGAHPMLSPPHQLVLVHAVQRPLADPRLVAAPAVAAGSPTGGLAADPPARYRKLTAWRAPGSHDAYLIGALELDGASTAKVDLEARWSNLVDDPATGPNTRVQRSGHADELRLDSLTGVAPLRAAGADQRSTGWYLPEADAIWFANTGDELGALSATERAAPRQDLGDTRHHVVTYRPVATSRFREYFEDDAETSRPGPELVVDVPSSVSPNPPVLRYAIPTFGWERSDTNDVQVSRRRGLGVRVYLERPWWSSGEDELLGVTLWPSRQPPPTDALRQRRRAEITQWGLDPIWRAEAPVHPVPVYWELTGRVAEGVNLRLPGGGAVDVAGHRVDFDPDRNLWYCDITFSSSETYSPMVRLSLARYQPQAIAGCELSATVLADVVQLAPDRTVTVVRDAADARRLSVTVAGIGPTGPRHSVLSVSVQRHDRSIDSDLGWRDAPEAADVLAQPVPDAAVLWVGDIVLREDPATTGLRLLIQEEEQFLADPIIGLLQQAILADPARLAALGSVAGGGAGRLDVRDAATLDRLTAAADRSIFARGPLRSIGVPGPAALRRALAGGSAGVRRDRPAGAGRRRHDRTRDYQPARQHGPTGRNRRARRAATAVAGTGRSQLVAARRGPGRGRHRPGRAAGAAALASQRGRPRQAGAGVAECRRAGTVTHRRRPPRTTDRGSGERIPGGAGTGPNRDGADRYLVAAAAVDLLHTARTRSRSATHDRPGRHRRPEPAEPGRGDSPRPGHRRLRRRHHGWGDEFPAAARARPERGSRPADLASVGAGAAGGRPRRQPAGLASARHGSHSARPVARQCRHRGAGTGVDRPGRAAERRRVAGGMARRCRRAAVRPAAE